MRKITIRNHSTVLDSEIVKYVGMMLSEGYTEETYKGLHIKQVKDTDLEAAFKAWEE